MSIIAGKMAPTFGTVIMGKNTEILQFDQHREVLDQKATLKETLANHGDYVRIDEKNIHIASYLEKYLFSPGDANRRVNTLSGGEQNRLMLAKLMRQNANCLLLDEPTNDLDMASLAALEEVLLDYPGVIFTVSHDRRFLNRVCNMIIAFEQGVDAESKLEIYPGNFDSYQSLKEKNEPEKVFETKDEPKKTERTKSKKKRSFKEEQEFKELPALLEKLEQEQAKLHEELSHPETFKVQEQNLVQEKVARAEHLGTRIEKLYERWQELSDIGEQ
jgi:ATP-binding cassette subfamily F protein uup